MHPMHVAPAFQAGRHGASSMRAVRWAVPQPLSACAQAGAGLALTLADVLLLLALPGVGLCHLIIAKLVQAQAERRSKQAGPASRFGGRRGLLAAEAQCLQAPR